MGPNQIRNVLEGTGFRELNNHGMKDSKAGFLTVRRYWGPDI